MLLKRLISFIAGLLMLHGSPQTAAPTNAALKTFAYRYGGMVMPRIAGIDVRSSEDGYIADFLLGGGDNIEGIPLSDNDIEALKGLMDEHELWSWAGFDEADSMILDGEGFSFEATFADGTEVSAHGSNSFPSGYWEAKEAFLSCIERIIETHGIELQGE